MFRKPVVVLLAAASVVVMPDLAKAAAPAVEFEHWVGEFEPGSDLEHYCDWVLDQVEVPDDDWAARKPQTGADPDIFCALNELDMIWLYLTPAEADKANKLIGQAPLMTAETAGLVELPTPVDDGGGPLAAPGQMGFQQIPTGHARIGVPFDEWSSAPSTGGVTVAIVDTGIDGRHDDLHVIGGFNCTQDERGPEGYDIDPHGHGSLVGGTVGAKHNDIYVTSAAPGVDLLSEVTFGAEGSASEAMVLCAVNSALAHEADIINASLGGDHIATRCGGPSVYTNGFCKASQQAVVVVAAGNDGLDAILKGPSNVPGVVSVGAVVDFDGEPGGFGLGQAGCGLMHRDDHLAIFSNWGSTVTVVAPGACTLSTLPGQSWGFWSGTSDAAPHVASVFAAFMGEFKDCDGQDAIKTVIRYAEQWAKDHPEDDYAGWPGAFPPPMIRYVDEDPLDRQDPEKPTPCAFKEET